MFYLSMECEVFFDLSASQIITPSIKAFAQRRRCFKVDTDRKLSRGELGQGKGEIASKKKKKRETSTMIREVLNASWLVMDRGFTFHDRCSPSKFY